jgi:hypothetical protein
MQIIRYTNHSDIRIKFLDEHGFEMNNTYSNFKRGTVKNPYDRSVRGIGYLGVGKHKPNVKGVPTLCHAIWTQMIRRCYSIAGSPYEDCEVCEEWLNYQNFADWYYANHYDIGDGKRMHLDKDILVKGNRLYSPETCMIVPQRINMIFMTKQKGVDADLPNAIRRCAHGYQAAYNGKSLGVFKTLEDAIEAHDTSKRIHIKQVAEEYRLRIPPKLYNAMLAW